MENKSEIKNIFVGCSSRDIDNNNFNKLAEDIGNFIVENNLNYVFGGCKDGLMGKIYSIVKNSNSDIIVTMAKAYEEELKGLSYSKSYLYNTVNERKNGFISLSDIMIFIPGGIGTIDELFTAIEACRSKDYTVPIIIINIDGFFDPVLDMFEKIYNLKLADNKSRELYFVANSFDEAKQYILNLQK